MFRLGYKFSRFHVAVTNPSSNIIQHECSFCKNLNPHFSRIFPQVVLHNTNFSGRMNLSTHTGLREKLKKIKKRKNVIQKYVELIQISDKHTNESLEKRAKIRKSSAENTLKQFGVSSAIVQKETSPSEEKEKQETKKIPKVVKRPKTDCGLTSADETGFSDFRLDQMSQINEEIDHEFEVELETAKQQFSEKNKKDDESSTNLGQPAHKRDIRNCTQKNLLPFLDVCVNNNMVQQAFDTLRLFHNKHLSEGMPLNDVRLYNCVLEAFALVGKTLPQFRLFEFMKSGKVTPNLQSYAYWLEGAYRASEFDKIGPILNRIKLNKLNIQKILTDCVFVRNQQEIVLKAIRLKIPGFNPERRKNKVGYVCNLLQDLNGNKPTDRSYNPVRLQSFQQNRQNLNRQQIETEKPGFMKIRRIDVSYPVDEKTKTLRKKLEESELSWKSSMLKSYKQRINFLRIEATYRNCKKTDLLPYLTCIKAEELVDMMLREFISIAQFSESFSPVMMILHRNLGSKVMERYHLNKKISNGIYEQTIKMYADYSNYISDPKLKSQHISREYWELLKEKYADGPDVGISNVDWPTYALIGVGKFLYEIIQKDMKFDKHLLKHTNNKTEGKKLVPAFFTVYRKHDNVKYREEIKPNPCLSKLYELCKPEDLVFDANLLPMVCPPIPWTSIQNGGFLLAQSSLIRQAGIAIKDQIERLEHMSIQNVYPCLDSLSALGETPWIINSRVLDVAMSVFNNKGCDELSIPRPASECPQFTKIDVSMPKQQRLKAIVENKRLKQQKSEMYSLWCDMLYKLSIANAFRDKVFWFPHNIDFRGRTYPCPPHFNHLGNDVCRGILLFANGQPLGENGFDWLKIHLINLTGLKKRSSLKERLEYCNEILPEIMDSADKPLTGNGWWKKSDEPWQTLGCCMEIAKVLRSPDPSTYVCHFPVHQDGSCNGLQHYAALGRDVEGAEQVNLTSRSVPQDVYSRIAEKVEEERKIDAADNVEIAQLLDGHISRRVVKQPVMTTVYGVTRYGARLQIARQLKEIPGFPRELEFRAASYLVTKVFYCLETMFSATKEIQDWFTKSANLIARKIKRPVEWTTPIGLPVVQPYFTVKTIYTNNRKNKILRVDELPNIRKQTNGFPPNYIHSLDSTHMMLTSLFCQREGITFASVHDCFWTHPNTVAEMNKICREQFVALHNEPLLELLSNSFVKEYCSSDREATKRKLSGLLTILAHVPSKGKFDVKEVLKSTYFFS